MTTKKTIFKTNLGLSLLLLAVLLCTACGTKIIKGASPLVRMTELSHQDNNIGLQVSMRNLNGVDLNIKSIEFSLTVNQNEDEGKDELFVYNGPVDTNIVANGTETWSVEVVESETSRKLLDSLENGEIKSLPYALKGSVISKDDGTLRFEYEGHIYPLPGKPGHFR
jgi:hypothetical protein